MADNEESQGLDHGLKKWSSKAYKLTGFPRKTLWDWTTLLLIPLLLAGGGWWFNVQQEARNRHTVEVQRQTDTQNALDQRRDDILKTYLDNMSDLLLKYHLHGSKPGDDVSNVARGQTLVAIQRLQDDYKRKARILEFLHEVKLINKDNPIVSMQEAWLDGTDMSATLGDLSNDNLSSLALNNANLSHVDMDDTDLRCTGLESTNLTRTYLTGADLRGAHLDGANLSGAYLIRANLAKQRCGIGGIGNNQGSTSLQGANLSGAHLAGANLSGANLAGAILRGARYNTKPIPDIDAQGKPITIEPTQWPQGFDPKAAGATCIDC